MVENVTIRTPNDHIINAQVFSLYSSLPISQLITIINSILLYMFLLPIVIQSTANYWLLLLLTMVFFQLSLFFLYQYPKQDYLERDNNVWKNLFFYTSIISATIWGSAGIFLFPENDIHYQIFLAFVITGIASGSMVTLYSHRKLASLFLVILMTPIIIQFLTMSEPLPKAISLIMFLSLVTLLILCKHMNQQFIENITSSLEAKLREKKLLKYSAQLMQTQKLAHISGWEIDKNNAVVLSTEFNTIFKHVFNKKQEIIDTISHASKKLEPFDFELSLNTPGTVKKHWIRVIGGLKNYNTQFRHGVIQDISASKAIQLELMQPRQSALSQTQRFQVYSEHTQQIKCPHTQEAEKH